MESLSRLSYDPATATDVETDVSFTVKQTISQGINDGGVLAFRLPPDHDRFTDLNTVILRLEVNLVDADGEEVEDDKVVCLDTGGMHSIFSSCDVRFNEEVVSTMTAYPYTAALSRYLGCSTSLRDGVMDTLDGTHNPIQGFSDIGTSEAFKAVYKARKSRITNSVLIGRIYSDVLMSSRQYLPPGVSLGIDLRRAPDHFSLMSTENDRYKMNIKSASIYVRRLKLRPSIAPRIMEGLKGGGGITFNRLETRVMAVTKGVQVFRWLDCLNSASLPNRIYVGFVAQSSFYGTIGQLSTYFEPLNMSSLNIKLNGRDLLVEPIHTLFVRDGTSGKIDRAKSNAMEGFLTIAEVLNQVSDQTQPIRINHEAYLQGMTIYAIELGKCGEKSGSSGALDLEVTFGKTGAELSACCMIFTEKTERALIHPRAI